MPELVDSDPRLAAIDMPHQMRPDPRMQTAGGFGVGFIVFSLALGACASSPTSAPEMSDGGGTHDADAGGRDAGDASDAGEEVTGAFLVRDVAPLLASSFPTFFHPFGTKLVFFAYDASGPPGFASTPGVFVTDGTPAGTERIAELSASPFVEMGGFLYFLGAQDGARALFRTDGTAAGTKRVRAFGDEAEIAGELAVLETRLFIALWSRTVSPAPNEGLWRSDGTYEGTELILETVGEPPPAYLHTVNGGLIFRRDSGLYRASATSSIIESLLVDAYVDLEMSASPTALFFSVWGEEERTIHRTDGTLAGTWPLRSFAHPAFVDELTAVGDMLLFSVTGDPSDARPTVWASDGTPEGTRSLRAGGVTSACTMGGDLYVASDGTLFRVELEASNWESVRSFALLSEMVCGEDRIVLAADDGSTGLEPFVSDGTTAGTFLLDDIRPGPEGSAPSQFVFGANHLFFSADDGRHGVELYASGSHSISPTRASP